MQLPLILQGKKSGGQEATLKQEARTCVLGRQPLSATSCPPSGSPGSSAQQGQELAPLSWTAGAGSALAGFPTSSVPHQENMPPVSTKGRPRVPHLLQLESLLSPQVPLLDLLPVSPQRKQARPGPPLVWQGAAVQPLRLVGEQQACVTGNLDKVGGRHK